MDAPGTLLVEEGRRLKRLLLAAWAEAKDDPTGAFVNTLRGMKDAGLTMTQEFVPGFQDNAAYRAITGKAPPGFAALDKLRSGAGPTDSSVIPEVNELLEQEPAAQNNPAMRVLGEAYGVPQPSGPRVGARKMIAKASPQKAAEAQAAKQSGLRPEDVYRQTLVFEKDGEMWEVLPTDDLTVRDWRPNETRAPWIDMVRGTAADEIVKRHPRFGLLSANRQAGGGGAMPWQRTQGNVELNQMKLGDTRTKTIAVHETTHGLGLLGTNKAHGANPNRMVARVLRQDPTPSHFGIVDYNTMTKAFFEAPPGSPEQLAAKEVWRRAMNEYFDNSGETLSRLAEEFATIPDAMKPEFYPLARRADDRGFLYDQEYIHKRLDEQPDFRVDGTYNTDERLGNPLSIRPGGDPDLFISHSLHSGDLDRALRAGELYAPSSAIARGQVFDFNQGRGNWLLLPKLGALDPVNRPGQLHARDAYVQRTSAYEGKQSQKDAFNFDPRKGDARRRMAQARLRERLNHPDDVRLSEGAQPGFHQELSIALARSPFKSFKEFEASPEGARLLGSPELGGIDYGDYNAAAERRLKELWDSLSDKTRAGARGKALRSEGLDRDFLANLLKTDTKRNRLYFEGTPEERKALAAAHSHYRTVPSEYAELKTHGSVPLTGENFAGAVLRGETDQRRQGEMLRKRGIPTVWENSYSGQTSDAALMDLYRTLVEKKPFDVNTHSLLRKWFTELY